MRSWNELVELAKTEGFSVQLVSGDVPTSGYMVALAGHEERIPVEAFTLDRLTRYVKAHADVLLEGDTYLGAWMSDGHVFLDVSECVVTSRADAIELGAARGQLAVWDVVNSAEINTMPASGESGANAPGSVVS